MRRFLTFVLVVGSLFFLFKHGELPFLAQIQGFFSGSQVEHVEKKVEDTITSQSKQTKVSSIPATYDKKYTPTKIQTYWVTIKNGKLDVTGKATPYGKYYKADGVILYIDEPRANKKTTVKVPFSDNQHFHYEYPLAYSVGDVVVNLDEYYNGKKDDPNKVLGYAKYHLTDGDPYLLPSFMVQSNNPALKTLAENITAGKHTNTEKSQVIFKWVATHVAYNAPLVNASNPPIYSALQTYKTRVVLCSGYADLNAALHRAAGIDAKVVYGENHAWNEIKLNGKWQVEDPTYGSGFINLNTGKFVQSYHPAYFYKSDMHKAGEYHW
ncbi:transglutaminase-like domain-containing protein [Neobacillus niacini]|uniref:transglutaminase domain-containing protein n=1 Tax=Neobacillus niacini TaxID=86668 RepID=UPI00285C6382|nr:transglutaminase-like domain-containing protein [Neobacillus niacini]MDR7000278.1 transglutaminase-like putative cysteine protease [Neobacillus niacini]